LENFKYCLFKGIRQKSALVSLIFIIIIIVLLNINCNDKENISKKYESEQQPKSKQIQTSDTTAKKYSPRRYVAEIVTTYPHDERAFTQGFEIRKGILYETSGRTGLSSLRKIDLATMKIKKILPLSKEYFAEGMTILNGKIYILTYTSEICLIYDLETLESLGTLTYKGEGWGLTNDGVHLIMSNGTNNINFINPENFQIIRTISVYDENNHPVNNLNELEYIDSEIWANIWTQNKIAIIDPKTGLLKAWIDCSPLFKEVSKYSNIDVLNGIAYDKEKKRIYATGKLWPYIFEIKIREIN